MPGDSSAGPVAGDRRTAESTDATQAHIHLATADRQDALHHAQQHVAAVVERYPEAAGFDQSTWVAAVLAHLEPLPANRAWRVLAARHRVSPVAHLTPVVARRLAPAEGHRPQPACPAYCARTHREVA